jgi:hypothetical protein
MNTTGVGLSGSASFAANQSGATTFTIVSNGTSSNTASTLVARDANGNFYSSSIMVKELVITDNSGTPKYKIAYDATSDSMVTIKL